MAQYESNVIAEKEVPIKASESHLTVGLKNKVKELETALHHKESELMKAKKTVKYTKIHEIEAELKVFVDENYRLKNILEQIVQEKVEIFTKGEGRNKLQEECLLQAAHIKVLERDYNEAVATVKSLDEQNAEYEKKLEENEKKRSRDLHRFKKLLAEAEREKTRLKNEASAASVQPVQNTIFPTGKKTVTGYTKDELNMMELEKKKTENASLHEQLTEKNKHIQNLEKQLRELTKISTERHVTMQNTEKLSSRHTERTNKTSAVINTQSEAPVQAGTEVKAHNDEKEKEIRKEIEKVSHQSVTFAPVQKIVKTPEEKQEEVAIVPEKAEVMMRSVPRKRVQKVRIEDVKDFGYELNLCLRIRGITFEQLNSAVWPERTYETNKVSVKEVDQMLKEDPFNMKNEEDAELIARYLVEENKDEYLYFDENFEGDLVIVKSIFKKLIGSIPTWDHETAQDLIESISDICIKNYGSLRENLRVLCKNGYLDKRSLQEACKLAEVTLKEDQVEFIITKLFEKSRNIQKLSIEDLFSTFNQQSKRKDRVPSARLEDDRRSSKSSEISSRVQPVAAQKKPESPVTVVETKPKESLTLPVTTNHQNVMNVVTGSPAYKKENEKIEKFEQSRKEEDSFSKQKKQEKGLVLEKTTEKFKPLKDDSSEKKVYETPVVQKSVRQEEEHEKQAKEKEEADYYEDEEESDYEDEKAKQNESFNGTPTNFAKKDAEADQDQDERYSDSEEEDKQMINQEEEESDFGDDKNEEAYSDKQENDQDEEESDYGDNKKEEGSPRSDKHEDNQDNEGSRYDEDEYEEEEKEPSTVRKSHIEMSQAEEEAKRQSRANSSNDVDVPTHKEESKGQSRANSSNDIDAPIHSLSAEREEGEGQVVLNSNRLASQRTDHTNATQITEPKSEMYNAQRRRLLNEATEEKKSDQEEEQEEEEDFEQEEENKEENEELSSRKDHSKQGKSVEAEEDYDNEDEAFEEIEEEK